MPSQSVLRVEPRNRIERRQPSVSRLLKAGNPRVVLLQSRFFILVIVKQPYCGQPLSLAQSDRSSRTAIRADDQLASALRSLSCNTAEAAPAGYVLAGYCVSHARFCRQTGLPGHCGQQAWQAGIVGQLCGPELGQPHHSTQCVQCHFLPGPAVSVSG